MSLPKGKQLIELLSASLQHVQTKHSTNLFSARILKDGTVKVEIDCENEGSFFGNSPVGAIVVSMAKAIQFYKDFYVSGGKKLPKGISMKCYLIVHS